MRCKTCRVCGFFLLCEKKKKFGVDRTLKRRYNMSCLRKCWNWQTGMIQVHVPAMACGFKSHLPHKTLDCIKGLFAL